MIETMDEEIIPKNAETLTRENVFENLFNSYNYGNLGMFIGAGFSKAVIEDDGCQEALNWFELIQTVSERLELDFPKNIELLGISLPEVSTKLCRQLSEKQNISYDEGKALFKKEICKISNWLPRGETMKEFKDILDGINPNWIITTNYDLVLETLLTGKCKSLNPKEYLSAQQGIIPIYHIHGTRLDSESIIITQEDYIPLFRPNEYRQVKLAMTIRESTTLVLGYGLGDMNVLSALDWSKNIYTEKNEYPYNIIQVFWTSTPKEEPYFDENGNIVIESDDIKCFLSELNKYFQDKTIEYEDEMEEVNNLIERLNTDEAMKNFQYDYEFRKEILIYSKSKYENYLMAPYLEFLEKCINDLWVKTSESFYTYDTYLCVLLDIMNSYEYKKMPPRLFQIIIQHLNNVLYYIDSSKYSKTLGKSWDATITWHNKKEKISKELINELYNYAEANYFRNVVEFTKILKE